MKHPIGLLFCALPLPFPLKFLEMQLQRSSLICIQFLNSLIFVAFNK